MVSAWRVNKAVVGFVKDRELVHQLIEDGIRNQGDVQTLTDSLTIYTRASSARVNWDKCESFLTGQWQEQGPPTLPGSLQCGTVGLKYLGVFLGTADFQMKNWEGVVGKVCAKLSQWTWVLPQLSYRGRVLVTNNLIASLLWHRFTVLEPSEPLIKEVQKRIVNFFWAGQHWTRAPVLYLLLQEGGQRLIDLSCQVRTFRLQAAQRLLYGEEIAWADTAYTLLWRVKDLNYDKHLFVLNLREMDLSATTLFYQLVLRAWSSVLRISRINAQPFPCTEEEPLFHNPLIQS
ncbi:hypothetical protein QTP86_028166 [Hemibagrus guttatus]|nr:hypothetical protein QTP86_028166 [Hemibagrus guttatus]